MSKLLDNTLEKLGFASTKSIDVNSNDSFAYRGNDLWMSTSKRGLRQEYRNFVYTCANIRAQEVAKIELQFFRQNPRTVKNEQPLPDHPFLQLLEEPNSEMSQYELFELTQISLDLFGLAYWYIPLTGSGVPALPGQDGYGIQEIEPWRVKRLYDEGSGRLLGYEVQRYNGTPAHIDLSEMICFKYPHELGIVAANFLSIDTDRQTSQYQNSQMRNGASPGVIVSTKGSITKDAFNKLKKQWRDLQEGAKNAGRSLFLRTGDFTVDRLSSSIADLNMKELKDIAKEDVREAFRIPKPKFGSTEGQGLGRDGAETVNYIFTRDVIDSLQQRMDDTLERYIRRVYKERLYVNHVNQIPENEVAKLADYQAGWGKWYTTDDIRRAKGLDSIDGGDVLLVPFSLAPLSEVLAEDETVPVQEAAFKVISRKQVALPAPIQKKSSRQQFLDIQNRDADHYEGLYEKRILALSKRQEQRVLNQFLNEVNKTVADTEYIDDEEEGEAFLAALLPIVLAAVQKGGEAAFRFLDQPAIDFVLRETVRNQLTRVEARLLKSFNEQTAKKIQKTLTQGLNNGETVEQLTARIKGVYGEIKDYRAVAIARSEANRAIAHGNIAAYQQLGIRQYQWVTQGEACPICIELSGTIIDVGDSFVAKGSKIPGTDGQINEYEPIRGGDAHPRCKCLIVPITSKAASVDIPQISDSLLAEALNEVL